MTEECFSNSASAAARNLYDVVFRTRAFVDMGDTYNGYATLPKFEGSM